MHVEGDAKMHSYESEGGGKHLSFSVVQRMSLTPRVLIFRGGVNSNPQVLSLLSCARNPKRRAPKSNSAFCGGEGVM